MFQVSIKVMWIVLLTFLGFSKDFFQIADFM